MRRNGAIAWWEGVWMAPIVALAVFVIAILPDVQPLTDLPAHMAQFRIQQAGGASPLAHYFDFRWRLVPNLGLDVPLALLVKWLPLELSVRMAVATIPALTVIGILWTAREVQGRLPVTALFALPLAFPYSFTFGFLNSCFSTALALIAFAFWVRLTAQGRLRTRLLMFLAITPMLLMAHMTGYGTFGILVGGATVGQALEEGARLPVALRKAVLTCAPLLWPILLLVIFPQHDQVDAPTHGWFDMHTFVVWAGGLLRDRWAAWDIFGAALLYVVMLLPILARRDFAYALPLLVPAGILWALALILPNWLIGSAFAAVRLVPTAATITILSVRPREELPRWVSAAAASFVLLRLATVAATLVSESRTLQQELGALPHIARGSRVAAFETSPCRPIWRPARFNYLAGFAVARRDAFVNATFAPAAGQLIALRSGPYPTLARMPVAYVRPDGPCGRQWPTPRLGDGLATVDWRVTDYLWLIDVPPAQRPREPWLKPLWSNGRSILYGVTR